VLKFRGCDDTQFGQGLSLKPYPSLL